VRDRRLHLVVTGLFVAIFLYSAVWALVDPAGTRIDNVDLGFPAYMVYPLAIAKLAGLAVILLGGSRTLTDLAFAGFLYDLLLALSAHVVQRDPARGLIAAAALVVTVAAWWIDRQRSTTRPPAPWRAGRGRG
jgi:hypothetical protein